MNELEWQKREPGSCEFMASTGVERPSERTITVIRRDLEERPISFLRVDDFVGDPAAGGVSVELRRSCDRQDVDGAAVRLAKVARSAVGAAARVIQGAE